MTNYFKDDEKELMKRIKDKNHPDKIRNRIRYSVDRSTIPMSQLKPYDPFLKKSAVDTKRNLKKAKAAGQMGNANDLVSKKRKSLDADRNANVTEIKVGFDSLNNSTADDTERNVKKAKADGNAINDLVPYRKRKSQEADRYDSEMKVAKETDISGDDQDSSDKEMDSNCNGNCQMTDFYRKELLAAQQRIIELQTETRHLQESNRKTVEDFSAQLAALNKNLKPREGSKKKQKTDDVPNHNKSFLHNAQEWTGACMLNDIDKVPEGMVHFGDKIFVDKKDIASKVEATSMEVRKRLKAILELIYPQDILRRTLDVTKAKFPNPLPISPTTVTIIAMALDKMLWDGPVDVTRSSVSSTIRRVMNAMREDAKIKSLPAEEQEERKRMKAEKVKASRAAKKRSNPGPRKNKSGRKNAITSSDEDSQEEDKDDDSQDEEEDKDDDSQDEEKDAGENSPDEEED
ncbi:hypothetical protein KUF71_002885 [Frankliniella fusca]|uniref:BEN domain-containing protein n=1 Tax=Frankliniella fusca TaxID=407009 RepID=A0AAE1GNH6_9NEOP|nr:hypothetical protein KUF71_002885 [Frankliniella fusca]